MRQVLVDRARPRRTDKRAGLAITLPNGIVATPDGNELVLAVDSVSGRLAAIDPGRARVVERRWLAGLEVVNVAQLLGVGTATVTRDWGRRRAY